MKNNTDYTDLQLHYLELDEYICENIYPINNIVFTEKINWLKGVAIAAGAIGLGFLLKWIANRYNINQASIAALSAQQIKNKQITAQIVNQTNALDNLSEEDKANKAAQFLLPYLAKSGKLNDSSIQTMTADDLIYVLTKIQRDQEANEQLKARLEILSNTLETNRQTLASEKIKHELEKDKLQQDQTKLASDKESFEKGKEQFKKQTEQQIKNELKSKESEIEKNLKH